MTTAERIRYVGYKTANVAIDALEVTDKIGGTLNKHKKVFAVAAALVFVGSTHEMIETANKIGNEVPAYAQEPERNADDLLHPKSSLRDENSIVAFNNEWLLSWGRIRKTPDTKAAIEALTARRRSVEGQKEAQKVIEEVVVFLAENPGKSNYDPEIGKLEKARQIILTDTEYKKKMEELGRKMFAYGVGFATSFLVLIGLGLNIKLKRQNAKEEEKKNIK